jgi:hypothetical protein
MPDHYNPDRRDPRLPPPKVVYRCILGADCMCDPRDATTQFCVNTRRIEVGAEHEEDDDD